MISVTRKLLGAYEILLIMRHAEHADIIYHIASLVINSSCHIVISVANIFSCYCIHNITIHLFDCNLYQSGIIHDTARDEDIDMV